MLKIDKIKLGVIGLGYVGLSFAVEFGKKIPVVGFDIVQERIEDPVTTNENNISGC